MTLSPETRVNLIIGLVLLVLVLILVFILQPIDSQHTSTITYVTITDREPPVNEYQVGYVYLSDHQMYMVENVTEFWKTKINSNCYVEMIHYQNMDEYRIRQVYNCTV